MSKKLETLFATIDEVVGVVENANEHDDSIRKNTRPTECLIKKKVSFKKSSAVELKTLKENLNSLNDKQLNDEMLSLHNEVKKLGEQTTNLSNRRDELEDLIREAQEKISIKEQSLAETEALLASKQNEITREIPYLEYDWFYPFFPPNATSPRKLQKSKNGFTDNVLGFEIRLKFSVSLSFHGLLNQNVNLHKSAQMRQHFCVNCAVFLNRTLLRLYDDLLKVQCKKDEKDRLVGYVLSPNHVPKIRPFEIDLKTTSRYNRVNYLWSLM